MRSMSSGIGSLRQFESCAPLHLRARNGPSRWQPRMSGRVAIFSRTVRMLRQITSIGLVMSERTWRVVPWTAWPARSNASSPVPSAAAAPVASDRASWRGRRRHGGAVPPPVAGQMSSRFDVEGERPAGGQLVGRVDGGSPGVVSADAHLGREQAQVVVARFGQVLVAACGLDRVGVPGQQAGREVTVAALGDAQSVALDVGGFEPADVLVAAGFLHHEIRRHARLRGGVPDAELAALLTVAVGLLGAGAVVAQTIVFAGQLPFDTERGQTGHVSGVPGVFDGQLHTHIGVDMVSDGHGRVVRIGKLVLVFRYETVIAFMDFRSVTMAYRPAANHAARSKPEWLPRSLSVNGRT